MLSLKNRFAHLSLPCCRGFSLVELSIVLVILGLLVGGILAGQSLIRASELRSIARDYQSFATSTQSFRSKYFYLPGDMPNATQFWGAAASDITCWQVVAATPSMTQTCNGNGDGGISLLTYDANGNYTGGASYTVTSGGQQSYEKGLFWQQLVNAGMLNQVPDGSLWNTRTRTASWEADDFGHKLIGPNSLGMFDGDYDLGFRAMGVQNTTLSTSYLLSPVESYNLDTKLDDGMPATGKVVVYRRPLSTCTDATGTSAQQSGSLTAKYLLTSNTIACGLIFRQQF